MPKRTLGLADGVPAELANRLAEVRSELGVPGDFPPEVLAEAKALAAEPPSFADHTDRTDIPFVTIDPPSSMDLDQAVHIERAAGGYRVFYAIADVGAWVRPGGAIDAETHRRGQTYYAPASRSPLHPPALSEAAASLLADGVPRPAMLWELALDATGELTHTALTRAMVSSRAKLSYEDVQAQLDGGSAPEGLLLLREVGQLRQAIEEARGGISLNLPGQEMRADGEGWRLEYRSLLPVEGWNAQLSLLTGIAAASIMVDAKIGILRTLPPAGKDDIAKLRRVAKTLQVPWERDWDYPHFVRSLDVTRPQHLAMMGACTALFRGAGYTTFDGELPQGNRVHAALTTTYAHTTAPLRRLIDRYSLEICHACANGIEVPRWTREALTALPDEMAASDQRARKYERAIINLTEALVLSGRVGETFEGTVIQAEPDGGIGVVQLRDPAVEARVTGLRGDALGREIVVRLVSADLATGLVEFAPAG